MFMRRLVFIGLMVLLGGVAVCGQGRHRFSPEKFQEELERFVVQRAALNAQETAAFLPVFREMRSKQKVIFDKGRKLGKKKPADERGCMYAIKQQDKMELELKKIQQSYHNKFLSFLPAGKVFDIIRAEEVFHRKMLKQWSGVPRNNRR